MPRVLVIIALLVPALSSRALPAAAGQLPPNRLCIGGRVLDAATNRPLSQARVFLYPVPYPEGHRPARSISDAAGEFGFTSLPEGSYRLGVNKLGFYPTPGAGFPLVSIGNCAQPAAADVLMSKGGVLAGRVVSASGTPLTGILVGAVLVGASGSTDSLVPSPSTARTDGGGEYRVESLKPGDYVIVAHPGRRRAGAERGLADVRTFFPGTPSLDRARRVTLGAAQTVAGLDLTLADVPTFNVSGIAVDRSGQPEADAVVTLVDDWPLFGGTRSVARTGRDGQFRFPGVAAGRYRLVVTSPSGRRAPATELIPSVSVTILDADVVGLVVTIADR